MGRLRGIRSVLGVALVMVTTSACDKSVLLGGGVGAQDMANGARDGFLADGGGAAGTGGAAGSGGSGGTGGVGGSGGAGGGAVDMAGGGPTGQVCAPTCNTCNPNNAGACCGGACCGFGEWCDAATFTCHCGSGVACGQQAVCISSKGGTCGDYCSPIL
jgi:hypothetical protein